MRKIYSSLEQVVIWLGLAADGSDDVMEAHARLAQIVQENHLFTLDKGKSLHTKLSKALGDVEQTSLPNFQHVMNEVVRIYNPLVRHHKIPKWIDREWFSRIWVIQELSLARDAVFRCGDKSLDSCYAFVSLQLFQHILWRLGIDSPHGVPRMTADILRPLGEGGKFLSLYRKLRAVLVPLEWQDRIHPPMGRRAYYMSLVDLLNKLYAFPIMFQDLIEISG